LERDRISVFNTLLPWSDNGLSSLRGRKPLTGRACPFFGGDEAKDMLAIVLREKVEEEEKMQREGSTFQKDAWEGIVVSLQVVVVW